MSLARSTNKSFNILIDLALGSVGKGAISPRLAEIHGYQHISCHNAPNAGHTAVIGDVKFVSKAIPTPLILNRARGKNLAGFLSPGCAFNPWQVVKEWLECNKPKLIIHDRALIVTDEHAARERSGAESTKHLASTMQGSGTALSDKVLRKPNTRMARHLPEALGEMVSRLPKEEWADNDDRIEQFLNQVQIVDGAMFRELTFDAMSSGNGILHEGSQGFGLSINHGPHFPNCTSRDCDTATAMSYMAVPPKSVNNVWGAIRAGHYIRVGNVVENGNTVGYSGDGYADSREITWEELGTSAGMPPSEIKKLSERELTTVTGRLRRVFTQSDTGLADAVRTCGVTALAVNFIQYISWEDAGKRSWGDLSAKSRAYIDDVEDKLQVPVSMVGTGAEHNDYIWR